MHISVPNRSSTWRTSLLVVAAVAARIRAEPASSRWIASTTSTAFLLLRPQHGGIKSNRHCFRSRTPSSFPRTSSACRLRVRPFSAASDSSFDKNSSPAKHLSDEEVERSVLDWVKRVVIGLNLCPFAEPSLKRDELHIQVVRDNDRIVVLGAVLGQMLVRRDVVGTSLVVTPELYPDDFQKFLSVVTALEEDLMDDHELHGQVQIAPFHPLFEFEGSGKEGIDNFTNKAPFPIFHILREDEVGHAVDKLQGDAGKVWRRNVLFLEDLKKELGADGVKRIMVGETTIEERDVLAEALKRHRFKVLEGPAT